MPSPFPGMNPFLENPDVWSTFYTRMLSELADRLSAQVRPDYLVHMEAHLWIHERIEEEGDRASRKRLVGRGDVAHSQRGAEAQSGVVSPGAQPAVLTAPVCVRIHQVDIQRQRYLEIRDRRSRDLVAVIELLSPVNKKPGPDREQYLTKRSEILASPAHFVEIDLLRGGPPMPDHNRPEGSYGVMVSRAEERPDADFWPIGLREPLPVTRVPLRRASHATLVLESILHHVYDQGTYAEEIYDRDPDPPLDPGDVVWARQLSPLAESTRQSP